MRRARRDRQARRRHDREGPRSHGRQCLSVARAHHAAAAPCSPRQIRSGQAAVWRTLRGMAGWWVLQRARASRLLLDLGDLVQGVLAIFRWELVVPGDWLPLPTLDDSFCLLWLLSHRSFPSRCRDAVPTSPQSMTATGRIVGMTARPERGCVARWLSRSGVSETDLVDRPGRLGNGELLATRTRWLSASLSTQKGLTMSSLASPARRIRPALVTRLLVLAFGDPFVRGAVVFEGGRAPLVIRVVPEQLEAR